MYEREVRNEGWGLCLRIGRHGRHLGDVKLHQHTRDGGYIIKDKRKTKDKIRLKKKPCGYSNIGEKER